MVSQGRYTQAAEQWHRLSLAFLSAESQLGRKKMWQYAGTAEALAAMAADKANDAMAYQYWADSTRYLMTGGTDWLQMRKKLHRRFEQANTLLSTQLQVADVASSVDLEWQQTLSQLQVWDEKLTVFSFAAPKLGMEDMRQQAAASLKTQPVKPRYIRPSPSPTGKKLSGINTGFTHENKARVMTVPITGPDAEAADKALTTDHSHPISETQSDSQTNSQQDANSPAESVPVDPVNPFPVKPLVIQSGHVDPSASSMEEDKTREPSVLPVTGSAPQTPQVSKANVVVTPVQPIQFRQEADLISGETVTAVPPASSSLENDKSEKKPSTSAVKGVVSRGNLETVEDTGVEALRRRSFAPSQPTSNAE
ncbi:hypothetical protein GCM10007086_27280 [Photobacterium aphoticum]|nr:hypothetical protein GCM10007086_27280 [Photobacterium aphoticum]